MPMPQNRKPKAADLARIITDDPTNDLVATPADVTELLATLDLDTTYDQEHAQLAVEVWDEASPINGKDVDWIKEHRPEIWQAAQDGDVVLVRDETGHVVQLQYHEADVPGHVPIPKGVGKQRGEQFREKHAVARALGRVMPVATEHVRGKRMAEGKTTHTTPIAAGQGVPPVRKDK